jgi:prolyl-tRNA synthetase
VKDAGLISLAKNGDAAYNAKSGELLLLPGGARSQREIKERLASALFEGAGLQRVDCGNDEAVFSLAERYVREWQDRATAYLDDRGRNLRILGWSRDAAGALTKTEEVMAAVSGELERIPGGEGSSFVEEAILDGRSFSLLFPCEAGSIGARPGFACKSCGKLLLADSPFGFRSAQPGQDDPPEDLKKIETPGANTIAELCSQLGIDVRQTLKAMLYVGSDGEAAGRRPVASFIRGDYNISMNKLSRWLREKHGLFGIHPAEKQELAEFFGEVAGYCGPIGLPEGVIVICDSSVRDSKNTVVGANCPGYHRAGCCYGRDFTADIADIALNSQDTPCPCGGSFDAMSMREAGTVRFGFDPYHTSLESKTTTPLHDKKLSYQDREGTHEYPAVWGGVISTERILLEIGRAR